MKKAVGSVCNTAFPPDSYLLVCSRNAVFTSHFVTQGLRFNKMSNFYCFIKNILK